MTKVQTTKVEWRDPPTRGHGNGQGKWESILQPLVERPGRWAMIQKCDSPQQAEDTAGNLRLRRVRVPLPVHDWEFLSRGDEVFAIYHGKSRPKSAKRVRRTQRGR